MNERGTDDQEHRHVSQTSTPLEAKIDVGAVTVPRRRIAYTTAQLHKNPNHIPQRSLTSPHKKSE